MDNHGTVTGVDQSAQHIEITRDNGNTFQYPVKGFSTDFVQCGYPVRIVDNPLANHQSLVVFEPHVLVDVSEAAMLLSAKGAGIDMVLTRRMQSASASAAALAGTLINAAFDVLVHQPDIPTEMLLSEVVRTRPLAAAVAAAGNMMEWVQNQVVDTLPALRTAVLGFAANNIAVEPLFISKELGLLGRADCCVVTPNGVRLIEMKSGKPPTNAQVYTEHAGQVAAYAALIRICGETRPITAEVWYPKSSTHPFRMLTDVATHVALLMEARNALVLFDRALAQRNAAPYVHGLRGKGGNSSYDTIAIAELQQSLGLLLPIERTAIKVWLGHAASEALAVRSGSGRTADPLLGVSIVAEGSDPAKMHLRFALPPHYERHAFRAGDPVVVWSSDTVPQSLPGAQYKGEVRHVGPAGIEISLRNKFAEINLAGATLWNIRADAADMSRAYYTAMRVFADVSADKRSLLLGLRPPRTAEVHPLYLPSLTQEQNDVVSRACAAPELFLIQGPPGTGKTSAVLRGIITHLLQNPAEHILAVAYTNRAANEICSVLQQHGIPYLRHGSKEGARDSHSIPVLAATTTPSDLAAMVGNARCIVATSAALYTGSEIWELQRFTTMVVDEASQILDPLLLGLMGRVERSILIGDQCQLPAVVGLPPEQTAIAHPQLTSLGIVSTARSGFERFMEQAAQTPDAGWTCMLTMQGRMHESIMHVASTLFYGGRLRLLQPQRQTAPALPWQSVVPYRVCSMDVDLPGSQSEAEAAVIVQIVEQLMAHPDFAEKSIGIITPFRSQNTMVSSLLHPEYHSWVTVDTVERFQGSERDVIIYGTAVATEADLAGITSEASIAGRIVDRKLNVALTRAREQFIVVGNRRVLCTAPCYALLLEMIPIHDPRSFA